MSGMLLVLFVQSLLQFGAKQGKWEGYWEEENYLDMSFFGVIWFNKILHLWVDLFSNLVPRPTYCILLDWYIYYWWVGAKTPKIPPFIRIESFPVNP